MRSYSLFLYSILLLQLFGCANYHLGTPSIQGIHTVQIKIVENNSFAPQLSALLLQKSTDQILRSGTLKPTSKDADARLEIEILDYDRKKGASSEKDTGRHSSFNLRLSVRVSLINNTTGEVYVQQKILSANTQIYPEVAETGSPSMEHHAMTDLAGTIARKLSNQILDKWQ